LLDPIANLSAVSQCTVRKSPLVDVTLDITQTRFLVVKHFLYNNNKENKCKKTGQNQTNSGSETLT